MGRASQEELSQIAADSLRVQPGQETLAGQTEGLFIFSSVRRVSRLFGLFHRDEQDFRVLDRRGVVKLQVNNGQLLCTSGGRFSADLDAFLQEVSSYNDAGQILPEVFVLHGSGPVLRPGPRSGHAAGSFRTGGSRAGYTDLRPDPSAQVEVRPGPQSINAYP